ncbi:hypothetical protein P43SY_003429 [Pythium insidiosum]|uniref:PDZ domain-containing protein n=1 Tax=Pythium insidiosum TaxID=114742 RepID=A0AAD5Q9Q5_PYTIN|nr:hypothetical protein P43SY_003429 [Pythium insidiosum]
MGSLGRGAAPEMQDYRINWNVGPLGLVLRADLGADMPPVVAQVLPGESVASLAGVAVGDLLVSINGKRTAKLGYDKAMRLLYKQRLPITLHFRIAQLPAQAPVALSPAGPPFNHSSQPHSQSHSRRGGNASTVLSTRSGRSLSVRSVASDATTREQKLRKQFSVVWERGSLGFSFRPYAPDVDVPTVDFIGSRGHGERMDEVCINDVLIAINGEKTRDLGVERVLKMLLVLDKPVVLRFHKSSHRIEPSPSRTRARSNGTRLEPLPERESEPLGVVQEEDEEDQPPPAVRVALEGEIQLRSEQPLQPHTMPHDELRLSSAGPSFGDNDGDGDGDGSGLEPAPQSHRQPVSIATDFSASKRIPAPPPIPLHEAREIVARSNGKTVETCQFGGLPLSDIREGSVQARLLLTATQ